MAGEPDKRPVPVWGAAPMPGGSATILNTALKYG